MNPGAWSKDLTTCHYLLHREKRNTTDRLFVGQWVTNKNKLSVILLHLFKLELQLRSKPLLQHLELIIISIFAQIYSNTVAFGGN